MHAALAAYGEYHHDRPSSYFYGALRRVGSHANAKARRSYSEALAFITNRLAPKMQLRMVNEEAGLRPSPRFHPAASKESPVLTLLRDMAREARRGSDTNLAPAPSAGSGKGTKSGKTGGFSIRHLISTLFPARGMEKYGWGYLGYGSKKLEGLDP